MAPLESLSDGDYVRIEIPGERGLIVSVSSDGFFVEEERDDGSTYLTTGLSKERVVGLIRSFVGDAKDWREHVRDSALQIAALYYEVLIGKCRRQSSLRMIAD